MEEMLRRLFAQQGDKKCSTFRANKLCSPPEDSNRQQIQVIPVRGKVAMIDADDIRTQKPDDAERQITLIVDVGFRIGFHHRNHEVVSLELGEKLEVSCGPQH